MTRYAYKAFDRHGRIEAGSAEATSSLDLERCLAERGLTTFELVAQTSIKAPFRSFANSDDEPWWRREIGRERRISEAGIARLVGELAILSGSGVSIDQALAMIAESHRGVERRTAKRLRDQVMEGRSLSEALRAREAGFGEDIIAMVLAAEAAADLPGGLARLSSLLVRRQQVATELRSALIYPIVLLLASIGVLLVVVNVLVPNLRPLFDEARSPMPAAIALLDSIQTLLWQNWSIVAPGLIISILLIRRFLQFPATRRYIDRFSLEIPGLSGTIKQADAARFARALGAQVVSGVSLLTALLIASQSLRNTKIRDRMLEAVERIRDGVAPSQALREAEVFPTVMPQLVAIGEGSGRLGQVLLQLAETFEQSQQVAIKRAMGLLTPLLTLGLGLLVGSLMLSVMASITSLNDFALR